MVRDWVVRHPLRGFVVLAYAISWAFFIPGALGGGPAFVVLGAFGPATAAALVTRWTGGSARDWFRGLWRWRVPARYYAYAVGLPPLLVGIAAITVTLLGEHVDLGSPAEFLAGYLVTLVVVALLGGGQEEPGWRGFALDRLEAQRSPLRATAILGVVWGLWHLPVGLLAFTGPVLLVWFYSWLYHRTGSVLLCVLLHASFNTSIGYLDLANASATVNLVFIVVVAAAATSLVAATRGRLGLEPLQDEAGEEHRGDDHDETRPREKVGVGRHE